jgi:Calx-beta domain
LQGTPKGRKAVRRSRRHPWLRAFAAGLLVAATILLAGLPASAACHAFAVSASPASVMEGGTVTVTVSRDGAVAPSQVDVSTEDGTADGGEDFEGFEQTASFTEELQQTFTIETTDDDADERAESFQVHLSNPGGCDPNPNFVIGPDAQVTIRDNDASPEPTETETETPEPTETETPEPTETETPEPTETPEETESTTASPSPEASPSPTVTEIAAPEDSDGGISAAAVAAIVGGAAAVIGGVVLLLLRRRGAP